MLCDDCIHKSKTRKNAIKHFPDEKYCEFWKDWKERIEMCTAHRINRQIDMIEFPFTMYDYQKEWIEDNSEKKVVILKPKSITISEMSLEYIGKKLSKDEKT